MEWLSDNWTYLLLGGGFVALHLFGCGGLHRHGHAEHGVGGNLARRGHGGGCCGGSLASRDEHEDSDVPKSKDPEANAPSA